jgi:drug/metabolite transporter (DMT)-like permease
MFQKYKYPIYLHLIIFLLGFTGILGKLIHLDAFHIVWHRFLIAFIGIFLAILFLKRKRKIHGLKKQFTVIFVGVIVAFHWLTFYYSIQLSTASLGILCLSTTTVHVTWLEPLLLGKPFSWKEFLMSLLVIVGIYIVSSDFDSKDYEALFYGLCSAFLAGVFAVANAQLVKETPASTLTLYEMGTGFVVLTIILFFQGSISSELFVMRWEDFGWLLFLGIVCTTFAFLATIEIVKHLGAFTVSLSINLEPVYTIILAIIILQENKLLSSKFYIGAVMIVLVVLLNAYLKAKERARLKT